MAVAAKKQRKLDILARLDSIEKKLDIILGRLKNSYRDIPGGSPFQVRLTRRSF